MTGFVWATILVLEDNAAVQDLIEQALRESGHRVLTTNNSLEALELMRRVEIDFLVVGDVLAERREKLVEELRALQPDLGVVSICGPDEDDVVDDESARLSTPFALDDLAAVIAAGLDGGDAHTT